MNTMMIFCADICAGAGAMLAFVHIQYGFFELEPYSSAGYYCTVTSVVVLVLVLAFFKDEKTTKRSLTNGEITPEIKVSVEKKIILCLLIFMMFNQFNELAVYDTLATPITKDHYGWKEFENSIL